MGIFVDAISERRSGELDLITNPSAFFASIFGETANDAGIVVNSQTALKYSPVLACTRILAESIAQVPWNVMRQSSDGKSSEIAVSSGEHKLLHRSPNVRQTSFAFRVSLIANTILHGGGFAELVWNGAGKLEQVRFIPSSKVTILESANSDDLYYEIIRKNGSKDRVHMSNMIHVSTLAEDGITGLSLIKAHEQGIGIGLAAEKHGASFLKRGARLPGLLTSDNPLNEQQAKNAAESWQRAYGGAENAGKTPVLSGLKWQSISSSMEDAQYIQTREFQVAECARVFRIPGVFLGLKETSTYASAEQFFLSFVKFTLAPWAEAIEQEFDRKLFPKDLSMYTHLDLRGLMRGDAASRVQYYKGMFDIGALKSDEARAEEDMNPVAGGNRTWVQQNLMPVDKADEVLLSKYAKPAGSEPVNDNTPASDGTQAQMKSVHMNWLESVVARIRSWKSIETPKAVAALQPVFRSWSGEKQVDVDAFCRSLAEDDFDEGFVARAVERFEEALNV